MEETIPTILNYNASQVLFRVNEFSIVANEGTGLPNGRLTFKLPQKSIINLSSIRIAMTNKIEGLVRTGAGNYRNAIANMPVHRFCRSVQWRCGGSIVCGTGSSSNYHQIYEGLLRATSDLNSALSKVDSGYQALVSPADDANESTALSPLKASPAADSATAYDKSARLVMSDILGFRNGQETYIDTSLFGDVELILELAGNDILSVASATATAEGARWSLSDISLNVKCVTSISPLYVELLANKLNSKSPIRWCYQNYTSGFYNQSKGLTLSVNTNCLDMLVVQPFASDPDTFAVVPANSVHPPKFRFGTSLTKASATGTLNYQAKINNAYYPIKPVSTALDVPSITTEAMFGASDAVSSHMLFTGYNDNAGANTATKNNFLNENFILIQKFCLQEGYVSKQLSGISSNGSQMNIDLSYASLGSHQLVTAFYTSVLVYDPSSGSVVIEA
jgi:hypothetical protein